MEGNQILSDNVEQISNSNGGVYQDGYNPEPHPEEESVPLLDISISNVVCSFSTKCHLNLKKIAMEGSNVEYHRQHGVMFRTLEYVLKIL